MIGAGSLLALAMLASTPDSGVRRASLPPKPMSGAIAIGSQWGIVTSVHRSPERNRAVGGAPNSFHLAGRAIDIARRPGVRHAQIEAAYRAAGYPLLESLDEGDHSHFAFGSVGGIRPAAPARVEIASVEAKPAPTCIPAAETAMAGRRRPGRDNICPDRAEAPTGYKPLETAP